MRQSIVAEHVLAKAKSGEGLSPDERVAVLAALRGRTESTEAHALLRSLSISGPPTPQLVEIAEQMWRIDNNDWWSQGAIYALCVDWGMTSNYIPWLVDGVSVNKWQRYPSTGIGVLSVLGSYLSKNHDSQILTILLSVLEEICQAESLGSELFWSTHLSCVWAAVEQAVRGADVIWDGPRVTSCRDIPEEILAKAKRLASIKRQ